MIDEQYQRELDRLSTELDIEREMILASAQLEIDDLIKQAKEQGIEYGSAFEDGFWKAYDLAITLNRTLTEAIEQKYRNII